MDEVAEVKSRLEITEVVGGYLPLKQAGRNLKAPCPFHQEKSASFMVSPEKGIYHCFGCGEGGDIFNFVMKMEGVNFREALEMLARKAGVELKARGNDDGTAKKLRERLLDAHALAVKYYQATLVRNPKALDYVVKQRRLTRETIRDFAIGYAPDSWNALSDFLTKQGYSQQELVQGGLAGQKDGRVTIYDLFRGRVMFPITDREGRTVGFTARVLDDGVPKYLNTPQTPLYDKSQAIYGLALAREAIRSGDEVVLVEGNMDVVASHQAGVKQVVAASGTALTLEQLRTLSKLTKNIKLAFDADRAGLAATERAIELGQKLGLTLRMVVLPEGVKDADELVARDVEAWRRAIGEAKYIVDYLFERFEHDFDLNSAVGKRGYTDRLAGSLRRLGDPVEQDHYVKLLAEKTGTSEEAVRAKIEKGTEVAGTAGAVAERDRSGDVVRRAVVQASGKTSVRVQREELFLAVNLLAPSARASLGELSPESFSSPERAMVYTLLRAHPEAAASEIAGAAGEAASYVNQLMLIGEEEFSGLEEGKLQQAAFEFARSVFLGSNQEIKDRLNLELQYAEQKGDDGLRAKLLDELKAIIDSEA
ncbi:MAG TPA: DNA primase [Candidatus Saccharimonadia bacterium]|nr:DNA primase [Candidatus Saccharimonadia bacterium]